MFDRRFSDGKRISGSSRSASRGNTSTEYMLMISMMVVTCVALATTFIPTFMLGVANLADDVYGLLTGEKLGSPNGSSTGDGGSGGYIPPLPGNGGPVGGDSDSDDDGSTDEDSDGGGDTEGESEGDGSENGGSGGDESSEEQEELECPYEWDEASQRWRDPDTGQYVSSAEADAAGC